VIQPNGEVKREYKWEIIGKYDEYPTRRLAERALQDRLSEVNSRSYRPTQSLSFKQLAESWQTNVLSQRKESFQASERSRLNTHLLPFFGKHQLREITASMVQEFIAKNHCGPKTVKNCIGTLRLIWVQATRDKYISKDNDWFEGLRLPEIEAVEQPSFTEEEIQKITQEAREPFRTFYWILGETGIRLGEGCALRVRAIDLDRQQVVIRHSAWQGKVGSTKSKRPRQFPISTLLANHLRTYVENIKDDPDAFLFSTKNKTPWNGNDHVKKELRPLLLKLGIRTVEAVDAEGNQIVKVQEGVGAHAFRHGNCSIMDRLNIPAKVRQERAGHFNFERMTLGTYTHADSSDHREAAETIGARIAPVERVQ
jgi:integrase